MAMHYHDQNGMDVLILDTDQTAAELMCALLTLDGIRAEVVTTLEAALHALNRGTYQAVLIELGHQDSAATETAQSIRAQARQEVKVIAFSASKPEDCSAFDAFIFKPID